MHKACMLVLEDDPTELTTFMMTLEKLKEPGDVFHSATSGAQAIEIIKALENSADRPCIFILDLNMPGVVQGFDVLRWIRSREVYNECAVIILTSSDDKMDYNKAMSLGATRFYTKKNTMLLMRSQIKQILKEFREPRSAEDG